MNNALNIFFAIAMGLISILLPPVFGLVLASIYTLILVGYGYRRDRLQMFVPAVSWAVILAGFLLPFKYDDKIISAPHQKVAEFNELHEVYSGAFFVFPEGMDTEQIELPQRPLKIKEIRAYIERETGMKSSAKNCKWGCNILTGCMTGPIIFFGNAKD